MIGFTHYAVLSSLVFAIGMYGALARRNAISVLMSIELMFNAANINFVAFSYRARPAAFISGQVFPLFVIAVAACEAAVGLALILAFYRTRAKVNLDEANQMSG